MHLSNRNPAFENKHLNMEELGLAFCVGWTNINAFAKHGFQFRLSI